MATSLRKNVVLHCNDYALAMESVQVTKTATMDNGSALVAAGTEAAEADVASVVGFIDDPQFAEFAEVGKTHLVNVVKRLAIVNGTAVKYSDVAELDAAQLATLQAAVEDKSIKLQTAVVDTSRLQ